MPRRLASVRSVETPLEEITDRAELARQLTQAAAECIRSDGAHLIILGCTDFELAAEAIASGLEREGLAVPLLCPFALGVRQAEMLVGLGLSQSKLTYPMPRSLK
jgi:allantoin racemase